MANDGPPLQKAAADGECGGEIFLPAAHEHSRVFSTTIPWCSVRYRFPWPSSGFHNTRAAGGAGANAADRAKAKSVAGTELAAAAAGNGRRALDRAVLVECGAAVGGGTSIPLVGRRTLATH